MVLILSTVPLDAPHAWVQFMDVEEVEVERLEAGRFIIRAPRAMNHAMALPLVAHLAGPALRDKQVLCLNVQEAALGNTIDVLSRISPVEKLRKVSYEPCPPLDAANICLVHLDFLKQHTEKILPFATSSHHSAGFLLSQWETPGFQVDAPSGEWLHVRALDLRLRVGVPKAEGQINE